MRNSPPVTLTLDDVNVPTTLFTTTKPPDTSRLPPDADSTAVELSVVVTPEPVNSSEPAKIVVVPAQATELPPANRSRPPPTFSVVPEPWLNTELNSTDAVADVFTALVPLVANVPPPTDPNDTPLAIIVNDELPKCVHAPDEKPMLPAVHVTPLLVATCNAHTHTQTTTTDAMLPAHAHARTHTCTHARTHTCTHARTHTCTRA